MEIQRPASAADLARLLADCSAAGHTIQLGGAFSKNAMGGPVVNADVVVSTSALDGVLDYEPKDLTVSVGAGMRFADFTRMLAADRQMVPLDPAFASTATVGGVVAANQSGPRRRGYGTARDMVIGMKFATLEGKLVQTGGMVVKNVAGLDMGKLMIGSFGTLAAIVSVNFKLAPIPEVSRTFVRRFADAAGAFAVRDQILQSVLQPVALDILNPQASAKVGLQNWSLILEASGNAAVVNRYPAEMGGADELKNGFPAGLREFTREFLAENPKGAVVRASTTLVGLQQVMANWRVPAVARAGSGVAYAYFADAKEAAVPGGSGVIESAPAERKADLALWPSPGNDFAIMKKVKDMFDPKHLLNPGRLYGRI